MTFQAPPPSVPSERNFWVVSKPWCCVPFWLMKAWLVQSRSYRCDLEKDIAPPLPPPPQDTPRGGLEANRSSNDRVAPTGFRTMWICS